MSESADDLPLSPLHSDEALIKIKLEAMATWSTEKLIASLSPGQPAALKARPDGTILDGHHRLKVLRDRGLDINALPRVVIAKDE